MANIHDEGGYNWQDESGSNIVDEAGAGGDQTVDAALQSLYLSQRALVWPVSEEITTWLQNLLKQYSYKPQLRCYIGTSDYAERVIRYPTIRRSGEKLKSVKINLQLANDDGALNYFFEQTYTVVNSVQIQLGDYHPTSGWEGLPLFTGHVNDVHYENLQCIVEARDRLWNFSQLKIGDTDSIVEIPTSGGTLPSNIAWTLCTCYGFLNGTQDISNPDIDWDDFTYWAEQFSSNNVLAHSRFDGVKIAEAMDELGRYTDSAIYIGGDGRLHFKKYEEVNSLDYTWTQDQMLGLQVDVNKRRLINKQWVYFDYRPESEYWASKVFHQDSLSVDTFGLYEEIEKSKNIWYVDTPSALTVAQRRISLYSTPPRTFKLESGIDGIWRRIGQTARFVDPFFNVTSGSGWRIVERELQLGQMKVNNFLDEATVLNAFYLDIDYLDATNRFLL